MSFSHLLARAPYYSPARFERPKRPAPSEVERRAYAPAPLVNPFETLSAPQFDSFVDDVSSRIAGALSYDRERENGKRRRGYANDDEYWLGMGGRPGDFLGQSSLQQQEHEEQEASSLVGEELPDNLDQSQDGDLQVDGQASQSEEEAYESSDNEE